MPTAAATIVMLTPRMPASTWQRTFEFIASPLGFQSVNPLPNAPAAARLRNSANGSFVLSGPVTDRVGLHLAGNVAGSTRVERNSPTELSSNVATLSGHVVYRASDRDHVQIFAEADRLSLPAATRGRLTDPAVEQRDQSVLVTSTWNRSRQGPLAWSGTFTLAQASSTPPLAGEPVVASMERLREGPVYEMAAAGESRRRRTSLSWRGEAVPMRWLGLRHHPAFGATASWSGARREAPGESLIGELVDGEPARAWRYNSDGGTSRWSGSEAALWATDEIAITSRIDVDLGLRASTAGVSREGASIRWNSLSPSILGTYRAINNGWLTFLAGYSLYDQRLPLNYLAFGDPHALSGSVHLWNDGNADLIPQAGEVGVTIAAVGPCCANGRPNTIAADLRAPRMKEVRAVLQTRLSETIILRLGGTDRRQYQPAQPSTSRTCPSNYTLTHVRITRSISSSTKTISCCRSGTVCRRVSTPTPTSCRTSTTTRRATTAWISSSSGHSTGSGGCWIGATAHKSEGIGGNRGYLVTENDQGVIGEIFSDANAADESHAAGCSSSAATSSSGRRCISCRTASAAARRRATRTASTSPASSSRRGLNQGTEFVPALPRGLTRFTYAFTLDTRIEKQLARRRPPCGDHSRRVQPAQHQQRG